MGHMPWQQDVPSTGTLHKGQTASVRDVLEPGGFGGALCRQSCAMGLGTRASPILLQGRLRNPSGHPNAPIAFSSGFPGAKHCFGAI